jgi:hypothetical protein
MTLVVDRNVLAGVLVEAVDLLFTQSPNQDMTERMTGLYAGHLLLLWNRREAWQQGSPSEENSQDAQKIEDMIAAALVRHK